MNAQLERNRAILKKYIPGPAVDPIANWIYRYDFKLKIKRGRATKYGDYRPPVKGMNHQITINNNLNAYAFLITLVHEIAHLSNWEKHAERVKPHGEEWKQEFRSLMRPFLSEQIFPQDVIAALNRYLQNPAASSCTDLNLQRTLKRYDKMDGLRLLEQLPQGSTFVSGRRHFVKGKKLRKRFICRETRTNAQYLFNPLAEVILVSLPLITE
ncbi:MAG: SprT-like domain-containing protein [Bacteroidota bacterium]